MKELENALESKIPFRNFRMLRNEIISEHFWHDK